MPCPLNFTARAMKPTSLAALGVLAISLLLGGSALAGEPVESLTGEDQWACSNFANGRLQIEQCATNGDGVVDRTLTSYLGHSGEVVEESLEDSLGEGSYRMRFAYRPDNKLAGLWIDRGSNGSVDLQVTYRYDEAGTLLSEIWDEDVDGDIDLVVDASAVAQLAP